MSQIAISDIRYIKVDGRSVMVVPYTPAPAPVPAQDELIAKATAVFEKAQDALVGIWSSDPRWKPLAAQREAARAELAIALAPLYGATHFALEIVCGGADAAGGGCGAPCGCTKIDIVSFHLAKGQPHTSPDHTDSEIRFFGIDPDAVVWKTLFRPCPACKEL